MAQLLVYLAKKNVPTEIHLINCRPDPLIASLIILVTWLTISGFWPIFFFDRNTDPDQREKNECSRDCYLDFTEDRGRDSCNKPLGWFAVCLFFEKETSFKKKKCF